MSDDTEEMVDGDALRRPSRRISSMNFPVVLAVFILGVLSGVPVALFGLEFFVEHALMIFGMLFALLIVASLLAGLVIAFRRPILERVVKRSEIEMERFARPMSLVARYAAEQKVQEAMDAAQELGELMLARYAWISTRRWLIATVTAFVAAIAALAGSALLFQQNQLLRGQTVLLALQTERLGEQNALISQQINLGEAQRSTSIVPELLSIGETLGRETSALAEAAAAASGAEGRGAFSGGLVGDYDLSNALRARIIAASVAARPYRYLAAAPLLPTDEELNAQALSRRTDLARTQQALAQMRQRAEAVFGPAAEVGQLTAWPVSPERGQLIVMLYNSGVMETEYLTFGGLDLAFAEVRLGVLAQMSLQHASLRYSDFSGITLHTVDFGAAFLEGARFRRSILTGTSFAGVPGERTKPPLVPEPSMPVWRTPMAGADFLGATIIGGSFREVGGLAMNFDGAVLSEVDFTNATIGASTFRQAVIVGCDFSGANLRSVDFDGAVVFDEGFLAGLAAVAVPESFAADRFELEPLTAEQLGEHPRSSDLWRAAIAEDQVAYRIKRVRDFD